MQKSIHKYRYIHEEIYRSIIIILMYTSVVDNANNNLINTQNSVTDLALKDSNWKKTFLCLTRFRIFENVSFILWIYFLIYLLLDCPTAIFESLWMRPSYHSPNVTNCVFSYFNLNVIKNLRARLSLKAWPSTQCYLN